MYMYNYILIKVMQSAGFRWQDLQRTTGTPPTIGAMQVELSHGLVYHSERSEAIIGSR